MYAKGCPRDDHLARLFSEPATWRLAPGRRCLIRAYAVFIIIGIVAALLIGDRRWDARGGERGVIYDIALWAVPFGLLGGRLYHLATDWQTYWGPGGAGFGAALRIWDGGLGIWGAVALGGVGAWIGCRRARNSVAGLRRCAGARDSSWRRPSAGSGNYFNQELYGRETTLPWGLEIFYRRDPSGYVDPHSLDGVSTGQVALVVQPTFLYELIWNVLVFVALIYIDRRFKLGHGRLFAVYVAGTASGASASSCCATTPPHTSPESGSIRSHRLSCSSAPWSTSSWRRRAARIPKPSAARITFRWNPNRSPNSRPSPRRRVRLLWRVVPRRKIRRNRWNLGTSRSLRPTSLRLRSGRA